MTLPGIVLACAWVACAEAGSDRNAVDWSARVADVPVLASAQEQMRHAAAQSARLRRWPAATLAAERVRVAASWIAVRVRFPLERACVAEASFRAAELLRWSGQIEAAVAELELVRALGVDSSYRWRSCLELAHIERRRRRFERALDLYLSVAGESACGSRLRDDAAIWAGKTYALLGRFDDARRWLRRVAESAFDALDRIRAYDEWIATYVIVDDIEAAAGVLAACRGALEAAALKPTSSGERVRIALRRMRCIALLEQAVARRRAGAVLHSRGDDDE
ncbi:MAG: hypothetical protein IT454_18175 [Planctomycetes bacterium]|nr:hypothetical protein [Planctomycetota bacterium]